VTIIDVEILQSAPDRPGALRGLLGVPEGEGPFPAVVVVHEVFGVDAAMREHVERLVGLGYLVLMPDLFSRGGARRCLVATFRALRAGHGPAFDDIEAARTQLLVRPDARGFAGVIGFCMGGGFALLLAGSGDYRAAAVNYGMLPADLDDALDGACPIVGSYGGRDRTLVGAAKKLHVALDARGITHDVVEYPQAGHSFLNAQDAAPRLMRVLMRPAMGLGHRPVEAADAWGRIDAFFQRELA